MEHSADAIYDCPDAWELAGDASTASITVPSVRGLRTLASFPDFYGKVYLRLDGKLAGFSIVLPIPRRRQRLLRGRGRCRPTRQLVWECVELEYDDDRVFRGEGTLRLEGRRVWNEVTGHSVQIPCAGSDRPYLRIMMTTHFRTAGLGWPQRPTSLLSQAELCLFTEIRPRP